MAKKYTHLQYQLSLVYVLLLGMPFMSQAKGFTWAKSMDSGSASYNLMVSDPPTITGFSPSTGSLAQ